MTNSASKTTTLRENTKKIKLKNLMSHTGLSV